MRDKESIEFIRQIIRLKTQTRAFSYPTYEEVYRHVFVHTAAENSGVDCLRNSRCCRAFIGGI